MYEWACAVRYGDDLHHIPADSMSQAIRISAEFDRMGRWSEVVGRKIEYGPWEPKKDILNRSFE